MTSKITEPVQTFKSFEEVLYTVNDRTFNDIALRLFQFQARENQVYRQYLHFLGADVQKIQSVESIPFLPVSFFKDHDVVTGTWTPECVFTSSGTTLQTRSSHAVNSFSFYEANCQKTFEYFFGPLTDYHFLALLPSYLEREGSSLIAMVDYFIRKSGSQQSGFYLNNRVELLKHLTALKNDARRPLLLGVTFALLDLAEEFEADLSHCIVMETGGMKGRRKEITREELHSKLKERFNIETVYSEYGMTEMLSQAYSKAGGICATPPWVRVVVKEINDPFSLEKGKAGILNIVDLANIWSCAFIETRDLARIPQEGYFEVLGRMDNSDIRGCNLLVG